MNIGAIRPWKSLNWPNRISLIRLLLVAPLVILIMNHHSLPWARHVALGILAVMAASDFLDGLLARRLNLRTRLGAILDPLADKVLIICSVVLLSLPDFAVKDLQLPNWVVVAVVGKDLWVITGFVVIFLVTDRFRVRPTIAGKACTGGQQAMVISVLAAPDLNILGGHVGNWIALVMIWVVLGLCIMAVISYTRLGLSFIVQEQKPLEEPPGGPKARKHDQTGDGPAAEAARRKDF